MDTRKNIAATLGEFVRRVRTDRGFSTTDIERFSRSGGAEGISDAYITRIENGYVTNVSPAKLKALAKGLQVSEDEIFSLARGITRDDTEIFDSEIRVAFKGFEELSDEDKRELLSTVRMLGGEIQRRRPKKPPENGSGKPKLKPKPKK